MRARAPPHTRGWTRGRRALPEPAEGSPAHAGMDPRPLPARKRASRLPRTRGDGPVTNLAFGSMGEAPPHTRGWTRDARVAPRVARGSPAHAGMDLLGSAARDEGCGLPRTRGDGPVPTPPGAAMVKAPPHTRGWTPDRELPGGHIEGSPAHAGMDPGSRSSGSAWDGLPRTRGDGPWKYCGAPERMSAPPHTRGWTRGRRMAARGARGSPAHAGMDPSRNLEWHPADRLPRTRGDGPVARDADGLSGEAPPHTRGWTPDSKHLQPPRLGSPAHAGMDLAQMGRLFRSNRLPRTRGDGPRSPPTG